LLSSGEAGRVYPASPFAEMGEQLPGKGQRTTEPLKTELTGMNRIFRINSKSFLRLMPRPFIQFILTIPVK
jgi:hypothetical protein